MERDQIVALVDQWLEAWQRRDVSALAAPFAVDGVIESPSLRTVKGREAIERTYFPGVFRAFPDLRLMREDELVIDDDGRVALVFVSSGTHRGEFLGMAPSGKRFQLHGVMLLTIANREIASMQLSYDFTGFLLELGILKARAPR